MVTIRVQTLDGDMTALEGEEFEHFAFMFHGDVLTPGDEGYDDARLTFNAMIDRRPALILRCHGTADVVDAVRLASEYSLLTAVRGGGHSVAGHSVQDDALLIDLSPMRSVWVDGDRQTARVQGGAVWADVDRETQLQGLATPGGWSPRPASPGSPRAATWKIIECTCGFVITGADDTELVANARRHARESHDWPDMSDEELLALATPVGD